jgi:hypothetical protein
VTLGVDTARTINVVKWNILDSWWTGNPNPVAVVGRYFATYLSTHLWIKGESTVPNAQKAYAPQYVVPFQAPVDPGEGTQQATGLEGFKYGQVDAKEMCDGIVTALGNGDVRPSANYGVIRVYLDVEPQGLALSTDYWNGWASYIYNQIHIYKDPITGVSKPLQLWQPCIYCYSSEVVHQNTTAPFGPDPAVANALSPANSLAAPCYGFYYTRSCTVGSTTPSFKFNAQTATEASLQSVMTTAFPPWSQPDMDGHTLMNVHVLAWQYLTDQDFGDGSGDSIDLDVTNEPTQQVPTDFMLRMP